MHMRNYTDPLIQKFNYVWLKFYTPNSFISISYVLNLCAGILSLITGVLKIILLKWKFQ
jgi:hypothetical protein